MARNESLAHVFDVPNNVQPQTVLEQTPDLRDPTEIHSTPTPFCNEQEGSTPFRRAAGKAAAAIALAGYLWLGEDHEVRAIASDAEVIQTSPAEQNNWWSTYGSPALNAATLAATLYVARRTSGIQRQEGAENRLAVALNAIKSDSAGILQLSELSDYAPNKEYAPKIFRKAVAFLRDRKEKLDLLSKEHGEGTPEFKEAVRARRYTDREALGLIISTLPTMRKRLRGSGVASLAKRLAGLDEQYNLQKRTGSLSTKGKARVPARGINVSFLGSIKDCSFRDTNLTGAGMQGNQFSNVIFRNARICEAQLEGSTLYRCDLSRTDARAAYWHGATIEECVIDKKTRLGNLPVAHPDAKYGELKPERRDDFRGAPEVVLKNLIPKGMSERRLIRQIKEWQRGGLTLLAGSNPEYFLKPDDNPNAQQSHPTASGK